MKTMIEADFDKIIDTLIAGNKIAKGVDKIEHHGLAQLKESKKLFKHQLNRLKLSIGNLSALTDDCPFPENCIKRFHCEEICNADELDNGFPRRR